MTKNGKVHISMKDIWEVICCHGNNIQTRIMFNFVDCYSWLIITIINNNNNNNNNNNIAIGHGVGPAWAAAYYGRLDAPYLQSLGYYPWQVIATPKAPLSGLRHLAIYGLNRKPNYCYHVFWFHLFLLLKTSCCVWWFFVDLQVFVQLYLTLGRVLSIVRGIVFYILSEMAQTWNNTSERLYFQMMSIVSFS